jgi:hypothetical protein
LEGVLVGGALLELKLEVIDPSDMVKMPDSE